MGNLAFVVFKPDLVYQGLQQPVLEFLIEQGAELLLYKSGFITPEKRMRLYPDHQQIGQTNWDLGGRLYDLGPARFLVMRGHGNGTNDDFATYLSTSMKGHFVPRKASLETVRGGFNAMNPVFNLVHMSDTEEQAVQEAGIFFDSDELQRCSNAVGAPRVSLPVKSQPRPMSVSQLFFSVLDTVLSHNGVSRVNGPENTMPSRQPQGARRGARNQRFRELLDEARGELGSSPVHESVETMLDYKNYRNVEFSKLREQLTGLGVYLGEWDWYLLETTVYYFNFEPA
jgi:nucleoside diphosphate kinase